MTDHRSSQEIERELERERAGLADTLDDLREKFSVDTIIRQAADQIREHSGEIGASVTRAVKANPLALALTGVGLTWLIFSERHPAPVAARDDWPDNRAAKRSARARKPVAVHRSRGYAQTSDLPAWARDVDERHADMDADDDAESGSVKSALRDTAETIKDRATSLRERLSEGTEHLTEEGRARVFEARERANEAREAAMSRMADARDWGVDMFEDHPLVAGAMAVAVGAAIGAALPGTKFEDENFGAERDELIREAERILKEEGEKLRSAVSDSVQDAGASGEKTTSTAQEPGSGQAAQSGPDSRNAAVGMAQNANQRMPNDAAS